MNTYKTYTCCCVDSMFTIRAKNEEEARQIAENAKFDIIAKADSTFIPEQFKKIEAVCYANEQSDFICLIEEYTENEDNVLNDLREFDVSCTYYVDYDAIIEAANEDDVEELIQENKAYLFNCYLGKSDNRILSFESWSCEDCSVNDIEEVLCVA